MIYQVNSKVLDESDDYYLVGPDDADLKALETEFFETKYKELKAYRQQQYTLTDAFVKWLIREKGWTQAEFNKFNFQNNFAELIYSVGKKSTAEKVADKLGRSVEWVRQFIK